MLSLGLVLHPRLSSLFLAISSPSLSIQWRGKRLLFLNNTSPKSIIKSHWPYLGHLASLKLTSMAEEMDDTLSPGGQALQAHRQRIEVEGFFLLLWLKKKKQTMTKSSLWKKGLILAYSSRGGVFMATETGHTVWSYFHSYTGFIHRKQREQE